MKLHLTLLSLLLAAPASAQMYYDPYAPNGEAATVAGAYAPYQTHILKYAAQRYAVLFRPGYSDSATALRAVAPLCAAEGRVAQVIGDSPKVQLVRADGRNAVELAVRVDCKKVKP